MIFARAKLSYRMKASEPRIVSRGSVFAGPATPCWTPARLWPTISCWGRISRTLVITGPNTGGKTVTLNTIGLLALMVQCGLHIPVDGDSHIQVFSRVLADIGDEQSIAQSLSTFSSHM